MAGKCVGLIPAAGSGSRMGAACPKQYLPLLGRPVLFHSVAAMARLPWIERVYVVLSPADQDFVQTDWRGLADKIVPLYVGGESRAETVRNGLAAIGHDLTEMDWVLVHDAARPCLSSNDLNRLLSTLQDDPVGGLLAIPVADTIKRASTDGTVAVTVARDMLWQAQTPQMFRYGVLSRALDGGADAGITDEASAVEKLGMAPRLVAAQDNNFKVTYAQDLLLAEQVLKSRGRLEE